jgi:hypothetical protein
VTIIISFYKNSYDANGRLLEAPTIKVKTFKKLQWDLKDTILQHSVENAYEDAMKIINVRQSDLRVIK